MIVFFIFIINLNILHLYLSWILNLWIHQWYFSIWSEVYFLKFKIFINQYLTHLFFWIRQPFHHFSVLAHLYPFPQYSIFLLEFNFRSDNSNSAYFHFQILLIFQFQLPFLILDLNCEIFANFHYHFLYFQLAYFPLFKKN
jgi:hypothetical protein